MLRQVHIESNVKNNDEDPKFMGIMYKYKKIKTFLLKVILQIRNSNRVTLNIDVDVEKKLNDQLTFYTKLTNGLRWLAWLI